MFKNHKPEIILIDIQMLKMDGVQACKAIRELGYKKTIIALTANAIKHEVEEYLSLGFDSYIQKPINHQALTSAIAKTFDLSDEDILSRAKAILSNVDMSNLSNEFRSSLLNELEQLTMLNDEQDAGALRKLAHRLSGAAHLFGFSPLGERASALEKSLKLDDYSSDDIQKEVNSLIDKIDRIMGPLKEIVDSPNPLLNV